MADIIHVRREPHGAGLTRVTEITYENGDYPPKQEVVRYEHREAEQVDHYSSHFTGNFGALVLGGLVMAILVVSMVM